MGPKGKSDAENDSLERAPWEDGALAVDVTSVSAEVVLKNCLSDDLPLRLIYIKGLAAAATRASKRDLSKLLEALGALLEDEALGVRLETLQQLQQLAKMASCTAAPEDVEEAVIDALEQQVKPSLDPGCPGGGVRHGGAGTGALPMVREAVLASLDVVCGALGPRQSHPLLMRLLRAANAAQDKPGGVGPATGAGPGGAAGSGKASGDAALMALSLAALAVRHLDADRGGLAMAAMACRLCRHGDIRVREALAGALPQLYDTYASHPGALEQLFPVYNTLCGDKVWSVRQACARVAPELSQLIGRCDGGPGRSGGNPPPSQQLDSRQQQQQEQQQQERADTFQVRLLKDLFLDTLLPTKSQWVVTAVRQQAGAVIASLRPTAAAAALLPPLLDVYCAAAAAVGQGAVDVRRSCAESFADVVAKAGPERWPQLQPVLTRLLASSDGPTLAGLVASAERVVRLLAGGDGGKLERLYGAAEQVVSGPLLNVLRNQLHTVAPAASGALAGLLAVCPPELQRELLQVFPQLCEAPAGAAAAAASRRCGDWRSRLVLAHHLRASLEAVAPTAGPDAAAVVVGGALTLCADPVWAVRQAAAAQVGGILARALAAREGPPLGLGSAEARDHAAASSRAGGGCGVGGEHGAEAESGGVRCGEPPEPHKGSTAELDAELGAADVGNRPGSGAESGSRSQGDEQCRCDLAAGSGSGSTAEQEPPGFAAPGDAAAPSASSSASPPVLPSSPGGRHVETEEGTVQHPAAVGDGGSAPPSHAFSAPSAPSTPEETASDANGTIDTSGSGSGATGACGGCTTGVDASGGIGSGSGGEDVSPGSPRCRLTAPQRAWLERLAQRAVLVLDPWAAAGEGGDDGGGGGGGPGAVAVGLLAGWVRSGLGSGARADEDLLVACWAGANDGRTSG